MKAHVAGSAAQASAFDGSAVTFADGILGEELGVRAGKARWQDKSRDVRRGRSGVRGLVHQGFRRPLARCETEARGVRALKCLSSLVSTHIGAAR